MRDTRKSQSRIRALAEVMGSALFGIGSGLVFLEIVVRLGFPASLDRFRTYKHLESERGKFCRYDSVLGWAGVPNADDTLEWVDVRHHVRQNALGFRGPLYDRPRDGGRRVVVLGDSFAWGFGVEDEEVFPRVMERLSPTPLEVANLGVSGYGTDQEYLQFRSVGPLFRAQDVLLTVTLMNDIFDDASAERYGYAKPLFVWGEDGRLHLHNVPVPRPTGPWLPASARAAQGSSTVTRLASHWGGLSLTLDGMARGVSFRTFLESHSILPRRVAGYDVEAALYRPADPSLERGWKTFFGLVDLIDGEAREQGARLVVVLVPGIVQTYSDLWREFEARTPRVGLERLDPETPNRVIREHLGDRIPVIDLLPAFREAGRTNPFLYFPINGHWTRAGHRLAATTLVRELGTLRDASGPPPPGGLKGP